MLTVTVPAVLPPRSLRSVASTAAELALLTVTVMTSVDAVLRLPKSESDAASSVAVTTPVVLAAMLFRSVIEGLSLRVTVAVPATTKVSVVTKAAVA